jgi:cysteinyl-tRNA synthetase
LIFPHHENEIAQTEALTGKQFASYWIHNGLIKVNGQKMSKSLGNSLFLKDLLDRYSPETIKFALLQTNYRGDINVTDNLFPDAEKHLYEFYKIIDAVDCAFGKVQDGNEQIDKAFNDAMDDDFNTALAISNLYGLFKAVKSKLNAGDKGAAADVNQIRKTYALIGLFNTDAKEFIASVCDRLEKIDAKLRDFSKKAKQYLGDVISKAQNWFKSVVKSFSKANPIPQQIVLDTYKLTAYAQRLNRVNSRISRLDRRLDGLYWRVGLQGLWNLIQADALTGYSWRLNRCSNYLNTTANNFNSVERKIGNIL